jgi:hypothetical protein
MYKILTYFIAAVIFLYGCAGTGGGEKRLGTGKPKFASLEIEGMSYFLSSEKGYYSIGEPLKLNFRIKNISQVRKTFQIEKNTLLILQIKNEYGENLRTANIPASSYISGDAFSLVPGEEKIFEIVIDTSGEIFRDNKFIFCMTRLYFLPKQFRRNALSIYLDER